MPEGVGYPNTQAVAGSGLELNYVQDRVYAYSGVITTSTSYQTFLDFQTGKTPIVATLQLTADLDALGASYFDFRVLVNGIVIVYSQMNRDNFDWERIPLLLPPLTNFKLEIKAQGGTPEATAMFVGKLV